MVVQAGSSACTSLAAEAAEGMEGTAADETGQVRRGSWLAEEEAEGHAGNRTAEEGSTTQEEVRSQT